MAMSDGSVDDIFEPGGRLRLNLWTDAAARSLAESLRLARATRWDSVRSPHVFMGLLAAADQRVRNWADRLGANLPQLLDQFQDLFYQKDGDPEPLLILHREFLSDNVLLLLREAYQRARDNQRGRTTPMDLLICLLAAPNSIVAECFERVGVSAAKLTELAFLAEQTP
jgi:ATP-dependent Clp protease ATP-binding subunit ClpA